MASKAQLITGRRRPHVQANAAHRSCPHCGHASEPLDEPIIKRGAVTVALDPVAIWWRNRHVPLSPTEAQIFARVAQRGRLLYSEVDTALIEIGASPTTRALVLGHIRRKFLNMGACDPFERLGASCIRLRVDPDEFGRTKPVIGARGPRYACASDESRRAVSGQG